ncbi:MAG: hypothetical protein QGG14_09805 [Planctomycetota bacterium]|nr:hypothetical protein [Planctomycetota bacterium]
MSRVTVALATGLATGLLAGLPLAQKAQKVPKWRIDPYTKNDPKKMKRAGYVRYAPIEFGEHASKPVNSAAIDLALGNPKILWVESAHFLIGSALPSFAIKTSDRVLSHKLREELARLKKKLPKVNPKTRKLDPWLRIHLFTQRCEELYEDFSKRLGVTDQSFPTQRNAQLKSGKHRYWGEGPYLGQHGKYCVLILKRASDYSRYLSLFVGKVQDDPQRWNFKTLGCQLIATSQETVADGSHDTRMHCHIVFNVAHNLINGYRFYSYDLPVWFMEGMAHWFSRNVSQKYGLDFDQNESASAKMIHDGKWRPRVLKWMSKLRPAAELLALRDFGQLTKYDHVKSWSIIDFLMDEYGDEKWRDYMNEIKGYIDPNSLQAVAKEVLNLQRKGLRSAYRLNALTLDEKWKDWVMKEYSGK